MTVSDHETMIVLANGQTTIRAQDQGQKHPVFGFDQAKLRAFALQPEGPIVRKDFERGLIALNFDDLLLFGPIQGGQHRNAFGGRERRAASAKEALK